MTCKHDSYLEPEELLNIDTYGPTFGVCAAREIIPGLWGMSQTPGIISLGQHIAGESQGISRKLIFHQKKLKGFDKC